jgi:hypothetical protein
MAEQLFGLEGAHLGLAFGTFNPLLRWLNLLAAQGEPMGTRDSPPPPPVFHRLESLGRTAYPAAVAT